MGDMVTILGIVFGGVIAWIVYTNISNNMAKNCKNIAKKAEILIKKDMSPKCARCTFYMNNDYDNGYSQSEWSRLFKESVTDKEWDKNSKEYTGAVAPFINAIVVGADGYYVRRGMENRANAVEKFQPGLNDKISLNYFIEPYKYVKDKKRAILSEMDNLISEIEYKKKAPERAARARCSNCIHEHSCDWAVKSQTGSCGGYTPKEKKSLFL